MQGFGSVKLWDCRVVSHKLHKTKSSKPPVGCCHPRFLVVIVVGCRKPGAASTFQVSSGLAVPPTLAVARMASRKGGQCCCCAPQGSQNHPPIGGVEPWCAVKMAWASWILCCANAPGLPARACNRVRACERNLLALWCQEGSVVGAIVPAQTACEGPKCVLKQSNRVVVVVLCCVGLEA